MSRSTASPIDFTAIESLCENSMKDCGVPGLALAAVQWDEVVYSKGFGVTSVESDTPVTAQTLFRIGSTTKPLVGTAILRLVEQGLLDLDRPVNQYVSWLKFDWPRAEEIITLRMLLSHSSGLPTEFAAQGPQDPSALATSLREELPHYRFVAPPGRYWSYSNVGTRLAAHIAESVTGELLPRFMDRLVFEPLEMRRATFDPLMAMTYPIALPHDKSENGQLHVARPLTNNAARLPAGGVFASVLDLANFAILHLMEGRFGGNELLSASTLREMHRPQVFKFTLNDDFYGLTLESDLSNGIKRIGHPGSFPPYGSRFTMVTEAGVAVILLVNRTTDFAKSATAIVNSVLSQLLEREIDDTPPNVQAPERDRWTGFVGTYTDHLNNRANVLIDGDRLCASFEDRAISLICSRPDLYFGTAADANKTIVVGFPQGGEYIIINNRPFKRNSPGQVHK